VGQQAVHIDRMPVILKKEDEETWLNPDLVETERLLQMLKPYPADKMEAWRVGDEARNVRNDYPEVIKPLEGQLAFPISAFGLCSRSFRVHPL
jgi:putative SOS response-associated peptidase YedK